MDTTFAIMSPRTRRLHRGRPSTVLSNMTASNMTNMVTNLIPHTTANLSTSDSSFEAEFGPSPDELVINARGRRALPLTFSPDVQSECTKTKLIPLEKDNEDIGPCIKHLDLIINGNNNVTSSTQE